MEIIKRIFTERKVKDEKARIMTFTASDATRDAYGTVLNPDGWDLSRFEKNPIIGYQHALYFTSDPDDVIGKGEAYVAEGKLMVDVTFEPAEVNDKADKVWRKLQFGSLNAVSVGFTEVGKGEWGKGEEGPGGKNSTYYFAGQQLLEVSVVNIPANENALKNAMAPEEERMAALRKAALDEEKAAAEEEERAAQEKARQAEADRAKAELDKTVFIAEAALQL